MNEDIIVERHESSHYRSKYFEFEECKLFLRFRRRKCFPLPHEKVSKNGKAAFQCIIVYIAFVKEAFFQSTSHRTTEFEINKARPPTSKVLSSQRSVRGLVNSPSSGHEFRRHARAMSQLTSNCLPLALSPPDRPCFYE